jgi:hypothetical protein
MTHGGDIGAPAYPLKVRHPDADTQVRTARKGVDTVDRFRRLMVSLGWLAAFLMAVGAGWKNSN